MKLTDNQIWIETENSNPSILSDPRVSTLKVNPEYGWTPLHVLAWKGVKEAWFHHDFDKIKSKDGKTPKDMWIATGHKPVTCIDFIKYAENV